MTSEYTTTNLVAAELRATTSFSSETNPTLATVSTWIEEASAKIDQDAGMSFTETTYTEVIDYPYAEEYVYVKHVPVTTLTSVAYNNLSNSQTPVWTTKTSDSDYFTSDLDLVRGRIGISQSWSPHTGPRRFRVVYNAGYTTTPLVIQQLATKMVTDRVLSSLLNSNVQEGNNGGSIGVGSINIVEPADFGVGNYKRLKDDIVSLQNDVSKNFGVYRYSGI